MVKIVQMVMMVKACEMVARWCMKVYDGGSVLDGCQIVYDCRNVSDGVLL
jgi:hypothetical protein